jgi:hypothetical protein
VIASGIKVISTCGFSFQVDNQRVLALLPLRALLEIIEIKKNIRFPPSLQFLELPYLTR